MPIMDKEKPRFLIVASAGVEELEALLRGFGGFLARTAMKVTPKQVEAERFSAIFIQAENAEGMAESFCRKLRRRFPPAECAVILFGPKRGGLGVAAALDAGADDYWPCPLNLSTGPAYLRAILRRLSRISLDDNLSVKGLRIASEERQAYLGGEPLSLRAKEFDLLCFFIKRRGEALSRETLLQTVWGYDYFGTTRTIDFHVSQLRRKLGALGHRIETVAGVGYRFLKGE